MTSAPPADRPMPLSAAEVPPEVEELERAAAWRLRKVDADPADRVSAQAAALLEHLADDLRRHDDAAPDIAGLWTELRSLTNWFGESDLITEYADHAAAYRARIGLTEAPADGAAYLRGLLAVARGLV